MKNKTKQKNHGRLKFSFKTRKNAYFPNRTFEPLTDSFKQNQAHKHHPQIYTYMINSYNTTKKSR